MASKRFSNILDQSLISTSEEMASFEFSSRSEEHSEFSIKDQ